MSSLLVLLSICKQPQCGSAVERENMKVVRNGAMIRVHMVCNNNHSTTWDSSPMLGTGKTAIAVINVLISTYCLLTGLHIKQVNIIFVWANWMPFHTTESCKLHFYQDIPVLFLILFSLQGPGFLWTPAALLLWFTVLLQPARVCIGEDNLDDLAVLAGMLGHYVESWDVLHLKFQKNEVEKMKSRQSEGLRRRSVRLTG